MEIILIVLFIFWIMATVISFLLGIVVGLSFKTILKVLIEAARKPKGAKRGKKIKKRK